MDISFAMFVEKNGQQFITTTMTKMEFQLLMPKEEEQVMMKIATATVLTSVVVKLLLLS